MPNNLVDLVVIFVRIIFLLITLLFVLSTFAFFKGLAGFIFKADDAKNNEEGKNIIKWGLIVLFLMLSLTGILSFFYRDIFGTSLGLPLLPE